MTSAERILRFASRLETEFPAWDWDKCVEAAERIVFHADRMAFEESVLRDLARFPVVRA